MDLRPKPLNISVRGRVIATPLSARHYVYGTAILSVGLTLLLLNSILANPRIACPGRGLPCTRLTKDQGYFQITWWAVALLIVLVMLLRNIYFMREAERMDREEG